MDSDFEKEFKRGEKEDREFVEAMQALVVFEPFKLYWGKINLRIEALGQELMEPVQSLDATLPQEFIKGTMKGLILARDLPSATIGAIKDSAPPTDED